MKLLFLLCIWLVFAQCAVACPMCASGGPADYGRYVEEEDDETTGAVSKSLVHEKRVISKFNQWLVGFDARTVNSAEGLNDEDSHRQSQFGVSVAFRPDPNLFLIARAPYSSTMFKELGEPDKVNRGLGDTEILATYDFRTRRARLWPAVTLGLKLPTGDNAIAGYAADHEGGSRLDEHGQIGSGAWDGMFMVHLRRKGLVRFSTTAGYRINGENDYGYRFGRGLWFDLAVGRNLNRSFSASLGTRLRNAERNSDGNEKESNSGGTILLLTPEISYSLGRSMNLSAQCALPIVNQLNGEQSEKLGISASLTHTF